MSSVRLGSNEYADKLLHLENEVDVLRGRKPRNRYTCFVCLGIRFTDESRRGSPDFWPCDGCDGGRLIDEANANLDAENISVAKEVGMEDHAKTEYEIDRLCANFSGYYDRVCARGLGHLLSTSQVSALRLFLRWLLDTHTLTPKAGGGS